MCNKFYKANISYLFIPILLLLSFTFTACGGSTPASEPVLVTNKEAKVEPQTAPQPAEKEVSMDAAEESQPASENLSHVSNISPASNRLIIKNAEIEIQVEDTDVTINRSLGIVTEYGGYVVSNRTWFDNRKLKQATLTIGVPVENFEEMMRRLKDLALKVTNEMASGQDVTDEFVDLESRQRNLETTAARIREFMEQTKDVDEALRVNAQLSEIEAEIEQVKGRMSYLKDRAAFSTITLQIAQRPPSPSPTPTPAPKLWSASSTFNDATTITANTAQTLFQVGVSLFIWFTVVVLPFALPIVGLIWLGVRLTHRVVGDRRIRPPTA